MCTIKTKQYMNTPSILIFQSRQIMSIHWWLTLMNDIRHTNNYIILVICDNCETFVTFSIDIFGSRFSVMLSFHSTTYSKDKNLMFQCQIVLVVVHVSWENVNVALRCVTACVWECLDVMPALHWFVFLRIKAFG